MLLLSFRVTGQQEPEMSAIGNVPRDLSCSLFVIALLGGLSSWNMNKLIVQTTLYEESKHS